MFDLECVEFMSKFLFSFYYANSESYVCCRVVGLFFMTEVTVTENDVESIAFSPLLLSTVSDVDFCFSFCCVGAK